MTKWGTETLGGVVSSSAAPPAQGRGRDAFDMTGVLVRGAVVAVYVSDGTPAYPAGVEPRRALVYADCLVYSSKTGQRGTILRRVSCGSGGLHDGRVWRPRAATMTLSGKPLDGSTDDPGDLDGDHLLIGFIDGDPGKPTMLRVLDHPQRGIGSDDAGEAGQRDVLIVADGQPDLWKHHGSFLGFNAAGDVVVDTRRGHDGAYAAGGAEVPVGRNVEVFVGPDNTFTLRGIKADGTGQTFDLVVSKDGMTLAVTAGGLAVPVVPVARASHLKTLYTLLKTALDLYAPHIHPSAMGPTGPPVPPLVVPDWLDAIASDDLFIPDEHA